MSRLLLILRAAHCRSTHHYFALDALSEITSPQGQMLAKLLISHHDEYLVGAKAPDSTFRDFKNHVLHVGDGHWGGATKACNDWWSKTLDLMNQGKWKKAAFACGVLSHYFTDPIMPLHTGQSDRESIVHRPLEWSICKAYQEIYQLAKAKSKNEHKSNTLALSDSQDWLAQAVTQAAEVAHQHYESMLEQYDLEVGCKNPPAGLPDALKETLADLFSLVFSGWSQIVARLADETTSPIPETSLGLSTLLATIDMPLAWIVRKISDTNEQFAVRRILREYRATGKVIKNLPAENRGLRQAIAYERSVLALEEDQGSADPEPSSSHGKQDEKKSPNGSLASKPNWGEADSKRLTPESAIVDAPSIGPKTAKRFHRIGITTIDEFLAKAPATLRTELDTRWITEELLEDWQAQARLVCDVPALCGYKAQLLVAIDCRTAQTLSNGNVQQIAACIARLCATPEGERILRSSKLPDQHEIQKWIDSATEHRARAA